MITHIAEFIYCYLLRPWPLRPLTNWTIRQLLPKQILVEKAVIVLNPKDPVVSGALRFGVYEKAESRWFQSVCHPGMTFLDVGANIGYYTALGSHLVGLKGKVISVEPDPESFSYLEQTISANNSNNVLAFQVAASDKKTHLPLYISTENRGDNRLYASSEDRTEILVKAQPLDELLFEHDIDHVDLIKIDVQGYEPKVIEGLKKTISRSPQIVLITEFWPKGITDAGADAKVFLDNLRNLGLTLYELKSDGEISEIYDDYNLISRYQGRKYTNLIGRKQIKSSKT